MKSLKTQIVVVGGGAGGLQLAARLAARYGREKFDIILLERNRTHIWKPLLHEVAAGSLDANLDEVGEKALIAALATAKARGATVVVVSHKPSLLRDADKLSFAEIELAIADFGKRAREGKLTIKEMMGGTFTITNGGVFGSLLSTPILNPPQSGILGMHKIQDRPMAVAGKIEIRPMMYIALSYDHRIVDGKEAVSFLVKLRFPSF
jgi:pyruvate/2-oxoglutarate dehydrogenase complex dihydrolipoamide acyltransferase (E2) component